MSRNLAYVGIAIIAPVIFIGLFVYPGVLPKAVNGQAVVLLTTTETSTQTAYLTTLATTTFVSTYSTTAVAFQTVTQALPATVSLSGHAASNGVGTTATGITFTGNSHPAVTATVEQGAFTASLPNSDIYTVKIQFTAATGGGTCTVGTLLIATTATTMTASFSC